MFYKKFDLLKIYYLVFSLGLIKVAEYINVKVTARINLQSFKNKLCDWSAYYTTYKVFELSFFFISLILFSIFYFSLYGLEFKKQNILKERFSNKLILVVVISAILNLSILKYAPLSGRTVLFFIVLFFWGLSYFCKESSLLNSHRIYSSIFSEKNYFFICFAIFMHVCSYTLPLITHSLYVENDYMDIPEKTILSNNRVVDNTTYVNKHFAHEIVKYDPRVDDGKNPKLKEVAKLKIDNPHFLSDFFDKNFRRKYFYEYSQPFRQLKIFHREVIEDEKNDLERFSHQKKALVAKFSLESDKIKVKKNQLSSDELQFIKFNQLELSNQAKAGWFLFHHSWVLNPLHAVALGDSFSNQVLIYGFASSIVLKKTLDIMGGVNFQNYFKATFIFYPIYFFSFLLGTWFLFGNFRAVALGGLALGICYLGITYQLLVLAPGFNPLRHFWDIWVFVLFNEYLKKQKNIYLIGAILLGLFSIVWSKDFGIALYLGIIAAFFIKQYTQQKPYSISSVIGLLFLGISMYFLPIYGKNYNMLYMLMGVTVPGASKLLIILVLAGISLAYVLVVKYLKEQFNQAILMIASFVYAQIILIYFIWYPSIHHLIANATGIILLGIILLELYSKTIHKSMFYNILNVGLVLVYFSMSISFYKGKTQILMPFKHHVIHQWNFENAKFNSTMDPELFQESVELIQKYSHSNGMYLISKYDAILPVISNKYNKIPAVSVALDMIGKKDIDRMSIPILKNRPRYLFVDTDIYRNYINDIYNQYGELGVFLHEESIGRATVMDNMKQLFFKINDQYKLIEKGRLISVYQYKTQNNE